MVGGGPGAFIRASEAVGFERDDLAMCCMLARTRVGRRIGPALAGITALFAMIGSSRRAAASCVAPEPALLWSYPANGAVDVPIDADLIVTGSVFGAPTLDGVPLTMLEQGVYDLGELAAATRYEIRWDTAAIAFETGSERAQGAPPRLDARDLVLTRSEDFGFNCGLVPRQGCFDTGPPTTLTMQPPTGSVAWLVDLQWCDGSVATVIVPLGCGAPFIQSEDRIVCARLRATNGAAISEATELFCSVPDVPLATLPRGSACAENWPPRDALTIASPAGVAISADGRSDSDEAADERGCSLSWRAGSARPAFGVFAVAAAIAVGARRRARRARPKRSRS
jgi:hypothetical protein